MFNETALPDAATYLLTIFVIKLICTNFVWASRMLQIPENNLQVLTF